MLALGSLECTTHSAILQPSTSPRSGDPGSFIRYIDSDLTMSQQQSRHARQGRKTACTSCRENKAGLREPRSGPPNLSCLHPSFESNQLRCLYALPDSEDQDQCHRCVRLAKPCQYRPKRKRGPQNRGVHQPGESEVSSRTRSRPEPYTRPERHAGTREREANPEVECGYVSEPADFVAIRTMSKTARRTNLEMNLVQHQILPLLLYLEHIRWHSYQCWISWKVMCDVRFPFHRPIIRFKQGRAQGTEDQSRSSLQQAMQRGLDTSQWRIV